ncbi:MAG: glycosyltransferase [Pseudomonadota bacterium]
MIGPPGPDQPQAIVGLIRFSLVLESGNFFPLLTELSLDAYSAHIFDDARMALRLAIFEEACLPALAAQADQGFHAVLMASRLMPARWRDRVEAAVAGVPNVHFRVFRAEANIGRVYRRSAFEFLDGAAPMTATFRLDDDDVLGPGFVGTLRRYLRPELAGHAVTFVPGRELLLTGEALAVKTDTRPKASAGLAAIQAGPLERVKAVRPVYSIGSHRQIDRHAPLIVHDGAPLWLQTAHGHNVSERTGGRNMETGTPAEIAARLTPDFPTLDATRLTRLHALCREG